MTCVDLGFVLECDSHLLTNRYFPSKVGGKPAWLSLKDLPRPEELQCPKCLEPMSFLCQVYAPIEDEPAAFHRTIFIFICRTETCLEPNSASNIKAFRSQLGRENEFYSPIAPDEDEELPAINPPNALCKLCGCLGPLQCSQCKAVQYCSKAHQRDDWKGGHKQICQSEPTSSRPASPTVLLPEFEIEIEAEAQDETLNADDDEKADNRRQLEYEELVKQGKAGNLADATEAELSQCSASGHDDKAFRKFKKRTASSPEQILRYQLKGEPLLIAEPSSGSMFTIPDCEYCGSNRVFEFQVMPQLLNYLKDETLDWGTLVVYTCASSCHAEGRYALEYVVKQDVVEKDPK